MKRTLGPLIALLLSTALLVMGNGVQFTLLPIRADMEGFSAFAIGLIGAAYFSGYVLGCLTAARIIRRAGHVRSFAALASIVSAIVLVFPLEPEIILWCVLRAITGFCLAGLYMVIESWLNEKSTNEIRGRVMSVYTFVNLTVITIGQLLVNTADPAGPILFSLAAILFSLALLPVTMTTSDTPGPIKSAKIRLGWLYSISPVGAVGCLAVGMANGAIWSLGPIFAHGIGLSVAGVTYFMSAVVLGGALAQWPIGILSDRMDRRIVIALACLLAAFAGGMLAYLVGTVSGGLLALGFVYGAVAFPISALCVAHANDQLSGDTFVEASGAMNLLYGIGAVTGPLIAAAIMGLTSVRMLFIYTAAIHSLLLIYVLIRLKIRHAVPGEEKESFVPVPNTTSAVFEMDPRKDA